MFFSDYSHGPYQRWVSPQASSQVQHSRAGGAGPSSSSSSRASPRGASGIQEVPDPDGTPGPFTSALEEIQEGSALQASPYIRTGGVLIIKTSAITVPVSIRGDLIAPVIPSLEDQEALIRWAPYPGECRAPL